LQDWFDRFDSAVQRLEFESRRRPDSATVAGATRRGVEFRERMNDTVLEVGK